MALVRPGRPEALHGLIQHGVFAGDKILGRRLRHDIDRDTVAFEGRATRAERGNGGELEIDFGARQRNGARAAAAKGTATGVTSGQSIPLTGSVIAR